MMRGESLLVTLINWATWLCFTNNNYMYFAQLRHSQENIHLCYNPYKPVAS